jgi:hypothetical protein
MVRESLIGPAQPIRTHGRQAYDYSEISRGFVNRPVTNKRQFITISHGDADAIHSSFLILTMAIGQLTTICILRTLHNDIL